ncbi:MAG: hypothetical protein JWQ49_6036 [Edaphobacter sp.]|nr:hypothetical protein [Edaphobacter sp.]
MARPLVGRLFLYLERAFMKWQAKVVLILLSIVAMIASAQSSQEDRRLEQETQMRGYWADPSTGRMWAGKDNGKDVSWHKAIKYCRDLRLAGYSDWRLATLGELEGIYDKNANATGRAGPSPGRPFTFHVKGNLFLTGNQWSSTQLGDDRGVCVALRFQRRTGVQRRRTLVLHQQARAMHARFQRMMGSCGLSAALR